MASTLSISVLWIFGSGQETGVVICFESVRRRSPAWFWQKTDKSSRERESEGERRRWSDGKRDGEGRGGRDMFLAHHIHSLPVAVFEFRVWPMVQPLNRIETIGQMLS